MDLLGLEINYENMELRTHTCEFWMSPKISMSFHGSSSSSSDVCILSGSFPLKYQHNHTYFPAVFSHELTQGHLIFSILKDCASLDLHPFQEVCHLFVTV